MIEINLKGQPVTIKWKQAAFVAVLLLGGFTGGAAFPEYSLIEVLDFCSE